MTPAELEAAWIKAYRDTFGEPTPEQLEELHDEIHDEIHRKVMNQLIDNVALQSKVADTSHWKCVVGSDSA